jgi:hypothetical protein
MSEVTNVVFTFSSLESFDERCASKPAERALGASRSPGRSLAGVCVAGFGVSSGRLGRAAARASRSDEGATSVSDGSSSCPSASSESSPLPIDDFMVHDRRHPRRRAQATSVVAIAALIAGAIGMEPSAIGWLAVMPSLLSHSSRGLSFLRGVESKWSAVARARVTSGDRKSVPWTSRAFAHLPCSRFPNLLSTSLSSRSSSRGYQASGSVFSHFFVT